MPPVFPKIEDYGRRVTPQERFDAAFQLMCTAPSDPPGSTSGSSAPSTGGAAVPWLLEPGQLGRFLNAQVCRAVAGSDSYSTVDQLVSFVVSELVYPGGASDAQPVVDGWVYVVHFERRCILVEAHTSDGSEWHYRTDPELNSENRNAELPLVSEEIELRTQEGDGPNSYGFFLSPIRMTQRGMQFLLDALASGGQQAADVFVRAKWLGSLGGFVWLSDPWHWAAATHEDYYRPCLEELHELLQDAEWQAKLFVASVLKGWMRPRESTDSNIMCSQMCITIQRPPEPQVDVAGQLVGGEPNHTIEEYIHQESYKRHRAERAAAYLCEVVDSIEHHAVELSAEESGDQALSLGFQQWASVCGGILQTAPGRAFADQLVRNRDRLPRKYIFAEQQEANYPNRENYRFAWLAAKEIFAELIPAVVKVLVPDIQKVRTYLQHLGIQTIPGFYRSVLRNIEHHPEIFGEGSSQRRITTLREARQQAVVRTYKKLVDPANAHFEHTHVPTSRESIGRSVDHWHERWERNLGHLETPITAVVETANLVLAIVEWREANEEQRQHKLFSVIAASSHLTIFVTDFLKERARGGTARSLGALGGAATAVAGVVMMLEYGQEAIEAHLGENNYGQFAGAGIEVAGAALTAFVGSCVVAAEIMGPGTAIASLALGPVGVIAGAIGTVLIFAGGLVVWLSERTIYEQFAYHCYCGRLRDGRAVDASQNLIHPYWAGSALPANSVIEEVKILIRLMANFTVKRVGSPEAYASSNPSIPGGETPGSYIEIEPGYLPEGAQFDVAIKQAYDHVGQPSTEYHTYMHVHVDSGAVEVAFGTSTLVLRDEFHEIVRNEFGKAEKIRLALLPYYFVRGHDVRNVDARVPLWRAYQEEWIPASCEVRVRLRFNSGASTDYVPASAEFVTFDSSRETEVSSLEDPGESPHHFDVPTFWDL